MLVSNYYSFSLYDSDRSATKYLFLQAVTILGHTADELYSMKMSGDEAAYEEVFSNALFKTYLCKVTVVTETSGSQNEMNPNKDLIYYLTVISKAVYLEGSMI